MFVRTQNCAEGYIRQVECLAIKMLKILVVSSIFILISLARSY